MEITKDILYIGVNDHDVDLFEGQYVVPEGMAYNSYLIRDEKLAVMDTVDARFVDQWLENVHNAAGKAPDYLIVQHMEPDHSSGIAAFLEKYPQATVVSSAKAFVLITIDYSVIIKLSYGCFCPRIFIYIRQAQFRLRKVFLHSNGLTQHTLSTS